jgi:S-adenosyl-L-methionine hydrolase (adenosine-forming)
VTPRILTLTTDFGADGPYVAAMKGVILGLAPGTQMVDVSHSIAPQNIAEGSFVLAGIVDFFPVGTVHLAVVDPGVGTDRRLIAVEAGGHWFVLPDNGLIGEVIRGREPSAIWEICNPDLRRSVVSPTFHGRDILAPAAAHLLRGGRPSDLGPSLGSVVVLSPPEPLEDEQGLVGEVVFLDSFGNLITNIARDRFGLVEPAGWSVEILGHKIEGLIRTYGERPPGTLVSLIGSSNRVEVAVVDGDAARLLRAARGTPVRLVRRLETGP